MCLQTFPPTGGVVDRALPALEQPAVAVRSADEPETASVLDKPVLNKLIADIGENNIEFVLNQFFAETSK